ncbi:MAG: hypothetical protein ABSE05_16105 [Syntrophales bacterium]
MTHIKISKKNKIYQAHKKIKETISARKKLFLWKLKGRPVPPPHIVKQEIVKSYAKRFNVNAFIETGTFMGEMIDAVVNTFSKIISIEFDSVLAQEAQNKFFLHSHVNVIHGDSGEVLPEVMAVINEPCLFWLDAHYSGSVTAKSDLETPIAKELGTLLDHPCSDHVILIDDAREFTGNNDYPILDKLRKMIMAKRPDLIMQVKDDIIRIHKAVF